MAENIPLPVPEDLQARFWERVKVGAPDECWTWQGHTDHKGYGNFHVHHTRRNLRAHRVSYAIANGSLPDGMYICHRCDNPPCVNPAHLFAGTPTDNARDRDRKGRFTMPPHIVRKFTDEQILEILADPRSSKALARHMGVNNRTIGRIRDGTSYRHVTRPTPAPDATPPAPNADLVGLVKRLRELRDFLSGEDHLDGYFFGDKRDGPAGVQVAFWWREHLSDIDKAIEALSREGSQGHGE